MGVTADPTGYICHDAETKPDPIVTVDREDRYVHQHGPRGEDQAEQGCQEGEIKVLQRGVYSNRRDNQ